MGAAWNRVYNQLKQNWNPVGWQRELPLQERAQTIMEMYVSIILFWSPNQCHNFAWEQWQPVALAQHHARNFCSGSAVFSANRFCLYVGSQY